ncbi:MAG: DNA topoisomerase 3 [Defluviitaleaceae bacterium]|nr:DNA topoisomerase 3 [Defluviitaleaceae bacterium]
MSKLIICEKPSVAKTIATVVGATTKKDGYIEGNGYKVSWCVGHLLGLAAADQYNESYKKWAVSTLPIIPTDFIHVPNGKETAKQLKTVVSLIKDSGTSEIINAADAGREGELIFRLVYNYSKSNKPVKRLWISSMEKESIVNGLKSMKPQEEYENLYQSAIAREQADWLIGINATRLISCNYGNGNVLNVGRVVSPTLNMIVSRDLAIKNFVKEPFFDVELLCDNNFKAKYGRIDDKAKAEEIVNIVNRTNKATVANVESKAKSTKPPELYDLTTLQREFNRLFGFTAQETLNIVQNLYEEKILTYPRTDSKYITTDMQASTADLASKLVAKLPFLSNQKLDISNIKNVVNDKKVTDHHAIIPTQTALNADFSKLKDEQAKILTLVSVRLLKAISNNMKYKETVITLNVADVKQPFKAQGKIVLEEGFNFIEKCYRNSLKSAKFAEKEEVAELPILPIGTELSAVPTLINSFTSPPKPYTEDTLLANMEKANADDTKIQLGTPATRAGIIEKLIKQGFVVRSKKQLVATEVGVNLIKMLPNSLKSPQLTAEWEQQLTEINAGKLDYAEFMKDISEFTKEFVYENKQPKAEYKVLIPRKASANSKCIGNCPRCGSDVMNWEKTYSCGNKECGFVLFKSNGLFDERQIKFTEQVAKDLLSHKKSWITGQLSKKTGKKYDAYITLLDEKDEEGNYPKYPKFGTEFKK